MNTTLINYESAYIAGLLERARQTTHIPTLNEWKAKQKKTTSERQLIELKKKRKRKALHRVKKHKNYKN